MDKQTITDRIQFPALTGIRAVAAFMVFFSHLPLHLHFYSLQYFQYGLSSGVTLFFVLSGFLITYRYYNTLQLTRAWFRIYFIRRFARIYPVYFLLVTIIMVSNGPYNAVYFLQNYLLIAGIEGSANIAIPPSWSLTVEECYYIVAPFIMLLMKQYNMLLPLFIHIVVLAIVLAFHSSELDFFTANHSLFMSSLPGRFLEFFIGGYVAVRMLQGKYSYHQKGIRFTVLSIIALLIIQVLLMYGFTAGGIIRIVSVQLSFTLILPFIFMMLIYGLITESTKLSALLSTKTFDFLGKSSYVFYLLHIPLIECFMPMLKAYHKIEYNLLVAAVFGLTIGLSVLIYKYYERPMNGKIKKWLLN